MSAKIASVTDATYKQEVEESGVAVLIDFWAPWCGPCMALMPALEALAPMYEDSLRIVKINADENPELVAKFGVRGIPQLFWIQDGKTVTAVKGRTRSQLANEIDALLD